MIWPCSSHGQTRRSTRYSKRHTATDMEKNHRRHKTWRGPETSGMSYARSIKALFVGEDLLTTYATVIKMRVGER